MLVSALASLWTGPAAAIVACAVNVLAFNFAFVPPRRSFAVDLNEHALLLVTMLVVSWIVALLMARQRQLAAAGRQQAAESEALRLIGEQLREVDDPLSLADHFRQAVQRATGGCTVCLLLPNPTAGKLDALRTDGTPAKAMPTKAMPTKATPTKATPTKASPTKATPAEGTHFEGDADANERAGLQICLQHGTNMGPGTGRHEEQPAWYLPMRGRGSSFGAALVRIGPDGREREGLRRHVQAMCNQMGLALERSAERSGADAARESAQLQAMHNALLSAIAHDHRTPLATILGAASSLHDQADRLDAQQRRKLAATIVDEAEQLARLTDNTLQLARLGLDAPGLELRLDWESAEELVGTVMRRWRQRGEGQRIRARVEAGLPLVRCDAVLLVQLLDNLVDNALKYGGEAQPVEIVARAIGEQVVIAVRDRGPGIPVEIREQVFEPFQRGEPSRVGRHVDGDGERRGERRGVGLGLAVCRAIARAHGGDLRIRPRGHGGTAFELWLAAPDRPQPAAPPTSTSIASPLPPGLASSRPAQPSQVPP